MAKRFIDTKMFSKPFVKGLDTPYKLLWIYIFLDCDHAGIWQVEMDVAATRLGVGLGESPAEIRMAMDPDGTKIIPIQEEGKWFLPGFIEFQYGTLNPSVRMHKSVIEILKKYNLSPSGETLTQPFPKGLQRVQDKERDKEKDKDKEGGVGETEVPAGIKTDLQVAWESLEDAGITLAHGFDDFARLVYDRNLARESLMENPNLVNEWIREYNNQKDPITNQYAWIRAKLDRLERNHPLRLETDRKDSIEAKNKRIERNRGQQIEDYKKSLKGSTPEGRWEIICKAADTIDTQAAQHLMGWCVSEGLDVKEAIIDTES